MRRHRTNVIGGNDSKATFVHTNENAQNTIEKNNDANTLGDIDLWLVFLFDQLLKPCFVLLTIALEVEAAE
jgi:hypothetical protein